MNSNTQYQPVSLGGNDSQDPGQVSPSGNTHLENEPDSNSDFDCPPGTHAPSVYDLPAVEGAQKPLRLINLNPGPLSQEHWALKLFSWTWEIILTVLPLFFIALASEAIQLDKSPVATSKYGDRIVEVSRLGPTIYPILFAMVAARFYKNAARWHLERPQGVSVSSLEQMFGSQSFASALERLIVVRAQLLLGTLILSTWAMSPLGGQSSSRLVRIGSMKVKAMDQEIQYKNRAHQMSLYHDSDDLWPALGVVSALYSSCLLSSKSQQRAFMDIWGRPKIPQWQHKRGESVETNTWVEIDGNDLATGEADYASLIGIQLQGLDFADETAQYEFNISSAYIDFDCLMTRVDSPEVARSIKLWQRKYSNYSMVNLDDVLPAYGAESFKAFLAWPRAEPPYLLYASIQGVSDYSVFNCSMDTVHLETSMSCTAAGCEPLAQRQIHRTGTIDIGAAQYAGSVSEALQIWPNLTSVYPSPWCASATENYIANDEDAFNEHSLRSWTGVDLDMFSYRLTNAFNTMWQAGIDPYNITKATFADTPVPDPDNPFTNRTLARVSKTERVYHVDMLWAVLLIVTTLILQVLAVGGFILRFLVRGPDILGFASSLTRDNRFVPVLGGSSLDGAERARSLKDLRIHFVDVQPEGSCGYIAVSAVAPVDDEKNDQLCRPLEKNRLYS
ncbi:hypothetical protein CH63R_06547 [Colletotrichum higginsianum IMI 349063]|uniref:Uncharacterized protein n=1 Tax=Colletotrichum higginsianum (strain IMI 349063) TaxID=759273 RepID=A0A1B7YFR7_COLHI|nr:hypothetical protein CH63R_06547 [Colletotrichum higginsianum IMI 349063]OBR10855.1 hypothetical protein CH63R_06547 [Colletotrichum higginsianum IMI 349063]